MFGLEGHTATLYGEWIVIIGGKTTTTYLNEFVFTLNITTGEWKKLLCDGHPPPPRAYHSACLHGTRILVFGGITSVGIHNLHCNICRTYTTPPLEQECKQQEEEQEERVEVLSNSNGPHGVIYALNFATIPPRWEQYTQTTGTPPKYLPAHHAAAAHTTAMYVLGGCSSVYRANTYNTPELGSLYRLDLKTWHWRVVPMQIPLFYWGATLTPLGGSLFCLFGGVSHLTNRESRETFLLNVETGVVQHILVNECTPLSRVGHGAWRWGCFMYIFGGTGLMGRRFFNDVYRFDIPRRCWETVFTNSSTSLLPPPPPPPLTGAAVVCVGEYVYIIGGLRSKMIRTMDVFRLHMGTLTWSKVETTFSNSQLLFSSLSSPFTDGVLFGSKRSVTRGVQTEFEGIGFSTFSTLPVSTTTTAAAAGTGSATKKSTVHKAFDSNYITSNSKLNSQKKKNQQQQSDVVPHQGLDKEIKELPVLVSEWSKMITYRHGDDKSFIL